MCVCVSVCVKLHVLQLWCRLEQEQRGRKQKEGKEEERGGDMKKDTRGQVGRKRTGGDERRRYNRGLERDR